MADVHTLAKILTALESLSSGQAKLFEGQTALEKKFELLSTTTSEQPSPLFAPRDKDPSAHSHALGAGHTNGAGASSLYSHVGSFSLGKSGFHKPSDRVGGGVDALNQARRLSSSRPSSPSPSLIQQGFLPSPSHPSSPSRSPLPSTTSLLVQTKPPTLDAHPIVPGLDGLETHVEGTVTPGGVVVGGEERVVKVDGGSGRGHERKASVGGAGGEGLYTRRVVLTTYPGQPGVTPYPLSWGAGPSPLLRGPIICSRQPLSLPFRNAIGAHSGSYSIYRAITISQKLLSPEWRPDYTDTEPPFEIGPHPGWFMDDKEEGLPKIVSMDPWGARSQEVWGKEYKQGLDIRPTISQTKAHIKLPDIDDMVKRGSLEVDGKIVIKSPELKAFPGVDQGVEVNSWKAAIDPVWYLPGVARRLGVDETLLRRALFEDTGGMYPELLTRPDLKTFLPPIGGCTVYIFGDPKYLGDETKELTFRPHDECNGSDVFGSDICTCRPYLMFGIEEAVKTAQKGGCGMIVYFRKEGRALGEVTKYLVYNLRKRTGDSAERYFKSTELVAGVKDSRLQALSLPDVLAWLGVKKIDNLISMSDMKYNAIAESGVKVINRYEIPDELIPPDSAVEIQAKIAAGYFSSSHQVTEGDLHKTKGRAWEDLVH